MGMCPPAVVTAAIFTAVIVLDLTKKQYKLLPYHFLSGLFCTVALTFLCNVAGDFVGWCLLLIPFIILITGFIIAWINAFRHQPTLSSCGSCGAPPPCGCERRHKKSHHPKSTSSVSTNLSINSSASTWNWPKFDWHWPTFNWNWPSYKLKMESSGRQTPAPLYVGTPYLDKEDDAVYPTIPNSVTSVTSPPATPLPGCKAA
jgi:hypothetical protein